MTPTTTFVHCVHFWLKSDATTDQRAAFADGLRSLAQSPNVDSLRAGVPAGEAQREVVESSWDFQILVEFGSRGAHDRYQSADDAAHARFIEQFASLWTKVRVSDSIPA